MPFCQNVWAISLAVAALTATAYPAQGQRANDNAVAVAEDAFGTRVGNENTGLYNQNSARGFNPQQAGNVRLFGLYFDQQAFFGQRLVQATTMRIGLAAQSYPFPAPTGIVEINLHTPGDTMVVSAGQQVQWPTGADNWSLDLKTPLIPGKLGLIAGTGMLWSTQDGGRKSENWTGTALLRLTPTDALEIIPYIYNMRTWDAEVAPSLYTAGNFVPPDYDRSQFFGQDWADRSNNDYNLGGLLRYQLSGAWRMQVGLTRSTSERPKSHTVFYRNIQRDGSATLEVLSNPLHANRSLSGEARATGLFTAGALWRHTFHLAVRGRKTYRLYGGGATISYGPARIGVYRPEPIPSFTYGTRDEDDVRQIAPGISYVGQWARVGEFSVGLQKAFYDRAFGKENAVSARVRSRPWLYNGTAAIYATDDLAIYAGYTRGLEEFGTAPENAANRGQPMPAAVTTQVDAGLRYRIMPGISLVAGVFEVTKPYFDRNTADFYTSVGDLSHRGIELSLTGRLAPGLNVVAGAMVLQPRVSGLSVERGLIGRIPPGTSAHNLTLNVQYGPPGWRGLAVDTTVDSEGSKYANRLDTFRLPGSTTVGAGARYSFLVMERHATIRIQVNNIFNNEAWNVDGGSGRFSRPNLRSYLLRFLADF